MPRHSKGSDRLHRVRVGLCVSVFLVVLSVATQAAPELLAHAVSLEPSASTTDGIELLGSFELVSRAPDGSRLDGLSGLAWDADEQLLYAVSDYGILHHLKPQLEDGRLVGVDHVASFLLRDREGRRLRGAARDAEGLALFGGSDGVRGNSELHISFEREPRVARYGPDGRFIEGVPMPLALDAVENYASPNQGLEALAIHPVYGHLMLPEASLADDPSGEISLFGGEERRWFYRTANWSASSPTALEVLPGGNLLVLERAFLSLFWPLVISLRVVDLESGDEPGIRTLVTLSTGQGWRLDNFEGLALHEDDRFFMVSDNNGSRRQRTLLVYFRLAGV